MGRSFNEAAGSKPEAQQREVTFVSMLSPKRGRKRRLTPAEDE